MAGKKRKTAGLKVSSNAFDRADTQAQDAIAELLQGLCDTYGMTHATAIKVISSALTTVVWHVAYLHGQDNVLNHMKDPKQGKCLHK